MRLTKDDHYHLIARILHWLMAVILFYMILFSSFEDMPPHMLEEKIKVHVSLGLLLTVLASIRLSWRLTHPVNENSSSYTRHWQKRTSVGIHQCSYGLFFIIPVLGIVLAGFTLYPILLLGHFDLSAWIFKSKEWALFMNSAHGFAVDLLSAFIVVHVFAGAYKHIALKDKSLHRMRLW